MAAKETSSSPSVSFSALSYDTALCLIPPLNSSSSLNRVRCLYDPAYAKWPPHVKLVYPFVQPDVLAEAARVLCLVHLDTPGRVSLSEADIWPRRDHSTILLRPAQGPNATAISGLRHQVCSALRLPSDDRAYQPHMTIAKSYYPLSDSHNFLLEKVRLMTPLSWDVSQLAILVREPTTGPDEAPRRMKLWGLLNIMSHQLQRVTTPLEYPLEQYIEGRAAALSTPSQTTYRFDPTENAWNPLPSLSPLDAADQAPDHLVVASYNVLAETVWPPNAARYPAVVANILSARAAADILVLLEVTDHFLPFLLNNDEICAQYFYSTHGPLGCHGVGPLPSLLNVVVLSRLPFRWQHLPFHGTHKGAAVLTLPTTEMHELGAPGHCHLPLVLAACQLTRGLLNGAVIAQKLELQRLLSHLSTEYPRHPWIIAGDFSLATSSHTIDLAQRKQGLLPQCVRSLREIEPMLSDAGLQDAWLLSRIGPGESSNITRSQAASEDLYEGEQGATFDPIINHLAARAIGHGLDNRPQQYDRILVSRTSAFRPCGFNMFGETPPQASDHSGIRCLLQREKQKGDDNVTNASDKSMVVHLHKAPLSLGGVEELKATLSSHGCLPTRADEAERRAAVSLLETVLRGADQQRSSQEKHAGPWMVLIPVGSFGLGVWTTSSDVDCLCVGSMRPKTFFVVAAQRLRKAALDGIRILRRVRAKSGTMLELDVRGIRFDLQYCAAASIAENYPDVMKRPSSDPAFALPLQTLAMLKPARDLYYLRRSVPDMASYRLAHLLIKLWAMSRGLYAPKFGLLGGFNIAVMLVPICKSLASGNSVVSTPDIVTSFFHVYAEFDWGSGLVFDPFFHKDVKYHRTSREPLCLLGWHNPSLNTTLHVSPQIVRTLSLEVNRARALLSQEGITWNNFLWPGDANASLELTAPASAEFLRTYKSHVKIDGRYWGSSPGKGRKFWAWLASRCVMLLADMDSKVPAIATRMWPARFVHTSSVQVDEGNEYHGCYLIGLEWLDNGVANRSKDNAKHTKRALEATLRAFEVRVQEDNEIYDKSCCWMMASVASGCDLGEMLPDSAQWSVGECGETDSEEDLDEKDEDDEEEGHGGSGIFSSPGDAGKQRRTTTTEGEAHLITKPAGVGRFRTAADVMNRLRWDAAMDASDYLVGYEDRFTGAREKALEQWRSEQTDEEFIPQHRILYFKRNSDGVIVWERRTRKDDVFSSGI